MQSDLSIGDSIACDGICLTVMRFTPSDITVETMTETLKKTTSSTWHKHTRIHLEKALKIDDRFGGHIVYGHVDKTSKITRIFDLNRTRYLVLDLHTEYSHLVVEQGSICIDGVSLTIASLDDSSFTVALIDHTQKMTHLADKKLGEAVNLEFDIIGKYVHRMLTKSSKTDNITEEWLAKHGFPEL